MDKKEKEKELQRLISLTFDENPEVRRQAALKLAETDDPGAIFALLELTYDKDESVKSVARDILSKKQPQDKDAISFADVFGQPGEAQEAAPATPTPEEDLKKKKLLSPVEQIFERKLGKTKAAIVKDRMMSTIEKIYLKAVSSRSDNPQKREKSMQKMLTSYADILSGLDKLMFDERKEREQQLAVVQSVQEIPPAPQPPQTEPILEEIGTKPDTSKIEQDLSIISRQEEAEEQPRELFAESAVSVDKSIFRKAYEVMMASDGDEEVMEQQSQDLLKQLEKEVHLAFRLAKQRFKSENITHLTELRDGMRNVNTEVLVVKSAYIGEYMRTKTKKDTYTRIIVNDAEGSEGVIYLFEGRGKEVRPGMLIKVVKGQVKTFEFSKETAITVGKKGNVYIVL